MDKWSAARQRPPPDAQIIKRREVENRSAALQAGLKQIERHCDVAVWEQKSSQKMEWQKVKSLVARKKQETQESLNERRRRLAQLLQEEEEQYEIEYKSSIETPEQRVQRMMERAKALKDAREKSRLENVQRCLRKRDLMAQDEMRLQQSKLRTLKITKDRASQLEQKKDLAHQVQQADEEYARQYLASMEEKRIREEKERQEGIERNEEMKRILDSQVRDLNERKYLQANELEQQRQKWREEWRREAEEAKERLARKEEEQRLARREVQEENIRRAERRGDAAAAEAEMDRILLDKMMAKEREEQERRKGEQAALRMANKEFQEHLRKMAIKEAQEEGDLERLRFEESEKEWIKREARWKREAADREALMQEVDRVRQMQIAERESSRQQQQKEDEAYLARNRLRDQSINADFEAKARQEAELRLRNRELLQQQIAEKERMSAIERQRELLINQRAQRYTEEFQEKINKMREEALHETLDLENFPRKAMVWN